MVHEDGREERNEEDSGLCGGNCDAPTPPPPPPTPPRPAVFPLARVFSHFPFCYFKHAIASRSMLWKKVTNWRLFGVCAFVCERVLPNFSKIFSTLRRRDYINRGLCKNSVVDRSPLDLLCNHIGHTRTHVNSLTRTSLCHNACRGFCRWWRRSGALSQVIVIVCLFALSASWVQRQLAPLFLQWKLLGAVEQHVTSARLTVKKLSSPPFFALLQDL